MTATLTFLELLDRAGARPATYGRKWHCPRCPERTAPALAIDRQRELFYCHRCQWKGCRRALERELGIESHRPDPAEQRKARLIRGEAERFTAWARCKRIGTAALQRRLGRAELDWREIGQEQLAAGEPVSELVWARLELCWRWQEKVEVQWRKLCDFGNHAGKLYREFSSRMREAA